MADHSKIEWTDATWNPVTGCSVLSPGCKYCYAMTLAGTRLRNHPSRAGLTVDTKAGPVWNGEVRFNAQWLDQPLRWKRPRRIFVCAHGDLFYESVPDEWIDRVFAVMFLARQHIFQILTKRPDRMRAYLSDRCAYERWSRVIIEIAPRTTSLPGPDWFPKWATKWWFGVSAEDQERADQRIPDLLATPAAVRFVSAEPLLGPLRLDRVTEDADTFEDCGGHPDPHWPSDTHDVHWLDALHGRMDAEARSPDGRRLGDIDVGLIHTGGRIDWVIAGGESGPGARPMHPDWIRSLRDQCRASVVPFFFKQWGEWAPQVGAVDGWTVDDNPEISRFEHRDWEGDHWGEPYRPMWCDEREDDTVSRIGKKAAGNLLDGLEHREFPETPRAR